MAVLRGRDANVVDDPARGNGRGFPSRLRSGLRATGSKVGGNIPDVPPSRWLSGGIPWPWFADMVGRTVPWVFLVICNMN